MKATPVPAWAFHVPDTLDSDLLEMNRMIQRFRSGEISQEEFRAFRVPMGVYEQRESGTYMLRVRFPAGNVLPDQLKCLAETAQTFGSPILHLTTRQDIQLHRVPLDKIHPALVSLSASGMSTKGGGGNTVRNITACRDAGVCPKEQFDVAPFSVALTERFMEDKLSFQLPRKYKIALSGCASDCAGATVHDLGLIARREKGIDGFSVYVGGGMGGKSRLATRLHDFVPTADVFLVAEAVKRVLNKHGDRTNKHLARLRFLLERLGFPEFRQLYEAELAVLRASSPAPLQTRDGPQRAVVAAATPLRDAVSADDSGWRECNVRAQKQAGFYSVDLPLPLGDIEAKTMAALADVVASHGDGRVSATQAQNFVLPWIAANELPALQQKLLRLGLAEPQPAILRNLVACAGAATCRLGICLSRGLATAVTKRLISSGLDLRKLGDLKLHISGCPNSCGRHQLADVGLHGAARRIDGRLVPHYTLQLGGRLTEGQTQFGTNCGTIPARSVPEFLERFLAAFAQSDARSDFHAFLDGGGRQIAQELVARYREVPTFDKDKRFYFDWGADRPFSLAGRGPGECSAGAMDPAMPLYP